MTSRLKKYVTALTAARNYVTQWSADRVYADETLIVPFPTLAIYDPHRCVWLIDIKAWLYLPFDGKKIKGYFSSLPNKLFKKNDIAQSKDPNDDDNTKESDQSEISTDIEENERIVVSEDEDVNDAVCMKHANEENFDKVDKTPGRLNLFFVGNSVKVATKSIINGVEHLLRPSDESGFIEEQIELSDEEITLICTEANPGSNDRKFDYEIKINKSNDDTRLQNCETFNCTIYVLGIYGVSIISDIDDTIKVTNVHSKSALLKCTFYDCFKPVDGMNDLYQKWSKQKCQFHYVSASPWQLFPALHSFLEKYNYPMGTMNLRKFSWSCKYFTPTDTYKIDTILEIINAHRFRKFIFVGDSGEFDPEIYSKLYYIFPDNIAHIFIRDICQAPACIPTCEERYAKAFEGVPKQRWTIFKDPKEIKANIAYYLEFPPFT